MFIEEADFTGPGFQTGAVWGGKVRWVLITRFILEKAKGSWLLGSPSVSSLFQRVTNSDLGGGLLAASLSHELRDQLCKINERPQTFTRLGKSTVRRSVCLDGAVKIQELSGRDSSEGGWDSVTVRDSSREG